jgi:hypothetical protein
LLGRLGEGGEVLDGEALEPLLRLGSEHGRAIVTQEAARQASLLEALAQAVNEALGVFGEVPLSVTTDARAIVEHPEQHRVLPLATLRQHLALGLMEIAVPERVHVRDLERAALARHESRLLLVTARLSTFGEAVVLHVPAHGRVAGDATELGLDARDGEEIVVDEAVAPARMSASQFAELMDHERRDRGMAAGVARHFARQSLDGLVSVSSRVEPTLDGLGADLEGLARRRMRPGSRRESRDARGELAGLGRSREQRRDDAEAKPCPA